MIFDTHAHLNFNAFKSDLKEVAKRNQGVLLINVGSKYETSVEAIKIANEYDNMYAAIGLHPIHTVTDLVKFKEDPEEGNILGEVFDSEKYKKLASNKKVVAIGEIGLDYYYRPKTNKRIEEFKQRQKDIFKKQLDLAKELILPVILHCRMAHRDVLNIIKDYQLKGVTHCFTGSLEEAKKYIRLGYYIGLNGIIFKLNLDSVIKEISLDNILVETDCPYLTPPQEGDKRNEPIFVKHVIQKIAELKGVPYEEVENITTKNAKELFKV